MPARKRKGTLTNPMYDNWRMRISATKIVDRLNEFYWGRVKLSQTQVAAANILLRKVAPDLMATELTGKDGGPIEVALANRIAEARKRRGE